MFNTIRSHLSWKIFLTYLVVIFVSGIVLVAILNISVGSTLLRRMKHLPREMDEMMGVPRGRNLELYFLPAMNEALTYSAVAAFIVAGLASVLISRWVVSPVKAMMSASQHIAEGDYSKRIPGLKSGSIGNADELNQLAVSFNQMAEKMEQTENMRRQLIADVSHELRTPLTAIKGSMEGLMDGVLPAKKETYQNVHQEADRLRRLVDDLQELSRVESSGINLNLKTVKVHQVLKTAIKRMQPAYLEKMVSLKEDYPTHLPVVEADTDRVLQILINLLSNALQFTPAKGEVNISAVAGKKEITITVGDTGVGLRSQDLAHIFERFYRADKSRSRREGGGSGIGLSIAQTLVHAHGGRIWAESQGEGKGSKFSFTLPI